VIQHKLASGRHLGRGDVRHLRCREKREWWVV